MTRASRIFRSLLAVLLLIVGGALVLGWWVVQRPLAQLDGSVAIGGLKDGVIVDRDSWGQPWIRAKSLQDAVTAQGYVMAQDRLWQIERDFWRAGADLRPGKSDFGDATGGGTRGGGFFAGNSRVAGGLRAGSEREHRGARREIAD
jgi:hypothetical protein